MTTEPLPAQVHLKRWTPDMVETLRMLRTTTPLSNGEIGRRLGVSSSAVAKKLRDFALTRGTRHHKKRSFEEIEQAKVIRYHRMICTLPPLPSIADIPKKPPPFDRSSSPCCWPIGEPKTPTFRYCDAPARPGRPYCQTHHEIAYHPAPIGERAA